MPPTDPQTDIQPGDELVAYLDGELAPDESRRVEDRLAADSDYRRRLHELDQAWEALDALPKPAVDDNFARTTIEMVSVAAQRDVAEQSTQAATARRHGRWAWAAAVVVAAVAGFAATRSLLPDSNSDLLADLPVIQQFDVLSQIEDVEFLRLLPPALNEEFAGVSADIEREVDGMRAAASPSLIARQKWVESLSADKMANLEAQMQRFEALDRKPAEQNRLRALERKISQSADADLLRHRLVTYGRWLARQLPGDQEELRMLPTDERLELVRNIVRDERERAARRLSTADAEKLRTEIMEIYQERKDRFLGNLRRDPKTRQRFEKAEESRRALMVLHWELRNDDRDEKTRDRLIDALGPQARAEWDKTNRRRRQFQLWRWIWETMQPSWGPDELETFFANKLDNNQRAQLLSLRADEMQSELKRLYLASQFGLSEPNQLPGEPGRRGASSNTPPEESRRSDDERSRDDDDRRGDGRRRRDNDR